MILRYHLPSNNALYRFLIVLLIFKVFMRNIDIYSKERLIFIKRKSFPMRALKVLSQDQLIDCLSVVGGLLLVAVLLSL